MKMVIYWTTRTRIFKLLKAISEQAVFCQEWYFHVMCWQHSFTREILHCARMGGKTWGLLSLPITHLIFRWLCKVSPSTAVKNTLKPGKSTKSEIYSDYPIKKDYWSYESKELQCKCLYAAFPSQLLIPTA